MITLRLSLKIDIAVNVDARETLVLR